MPEPARVALRASADIPAPPEALWELISDWAGMLRWRPPADRGGILGPELVACELIGQHGSVPRTRRMTLSTGTVVDETIIHQDDTTRRISYTKTDDTTTSGYVATTAVDRHPDGGATVHIASTFDVPDPAHRAAAAARYEAIYAAMFRGYRHHFTSPASW